MSQRILVFESDPSFANEVKASFERLGAQVDVASDGPAGLKLAQGHKPDLILLTIELPGMNGFLVCKKIKKTAELEHVPLVILSSEVDEETFDQHKKLRTRADEYLRKPIAFAELLERVKRFVPQSNGEDAEDHTIEIEEGFSVSEEDEEVIVLDEDGSVPPSAQDYALPAAVEAFAEEALDSLVVAEPVPEPVPMVARAPAVVASPEPVTAAVAAPLAVTTEPAPPARASLHQPVQARAVSPREPMPGLMPAPRPSMPVGESAAVSNAEIDRLKRELSAAEQKLQAAEKRATTAEQRASGAEKALDAAKKTGGVSSRELLDLREQLNRKDRELLDLRDQVTARDKQLIEGSDKSLAIERELQDMRDSSSDTQRELDKKSEVVAALTADKESSKKRLDDVKARMERGEAKIKELGAELDGIKAQHELDLEELRSTHADASAKVAAEHSAQIDKLKGEHGQALAAKDRARADELSEVRDEHEVAEKAAAERADQQKRAELSELRSQLAIEHETKLADEARSHRSELSAALAAHENELRTTREQLVQKHVAELGEQGDKHKQELARVSKALSESESRHTLLEERYEETETARVKAEKEVRSVTSARDDKAQRVKELSAELERATGKLKRDEELLDRVRKAMAIGLGLLEEQKQTRLPE